MLVIEVNPAFTAISGYRPTEVLGKNPRMLSSGRHTPEFFKEFWDTLSAAEKKIVGDAADEAAKYEREQSRAMMTAALDMLKKNGMTVTEFSPAEVAKLREKLKPVVAKYAAVVGETTVNEVQAELAKLRK